ncbi:MAG: Fur family transcriptional regulator [Opitutales bacterium]
MRETRQRSAIKRVLEESNRPLSPREIQRLAGCAVPNLGIATVYRNLKTLVGLGELVTVPIPRQPDRYGLPGRSGPILFHCLETDAVYYLDAKELGLRQPALPRGYEAEDWLVVFYGRRR